MVTEESLLVLHMQKRRMNVQPRPWGGGKQINGLKGNDNTVSSVEE